MTVMFGVMTVTVDSQVNAVKNGTKLSVFVWTVTGTFPVAFGHLNSLLSTLSVSYVSLSWA